LTGRLNCGQWVLQGNPAGGFMGEGLFQPLHILLIIGIALLLFGPSKFADLGKGLGEGIRNFKASMKEPETKDKDKETPKPPAA
jgi:sec-independent protein translocase protein TatA